MAQKERSMYLNVIKCVLVYWEGLRLDGRPEIVICAAIHPLQLYPGSQGE
jgi:hypothetical protein